MSSVPRPLIAVLAVSVLFFAIWTVALKKTLTGGGSAGAGASSPAAPALQSAIGKARGLQSVVNSAGAKAGGSPTQGAPPTAGQSVPPTTTQSAHPATTPNTNSTPAHAAAPAAPAAGASSAASSTTSPAGSSSPVTRPTGMAAVDQALARHKVLALLFYNPASADDRAVKGELKSIPTHGGRVVKLTVPVQKLGSFSTLLNEVPVNFSPTLVLIDRHRQADEIVGFADSFEIAQRVAAALGTPPATHHAQPAKH